MAPEPQAWNQEPGAPGEPDDLLDLAEVVLRRDFEVEREQFEHAERRSQTLAARLAASRHVDVLAVRPASGVCEVVGRDFIVIVSPVGRACVMTEALEHVVGLPDRVDGRRPATDAPAVSWLQCWLGERVTAVMRSGNTVEGELVRLYRDHIVVRRGSDLALPLSALAQVCCV